MLGLLLFYLVSLFYFKIILWFILIFITIIHFIHLIDNVFSLNYHRHFVILLIHVFILIFSDFI